MVLPVKSATKKNAIAAKNEKIGPNTIGPLFAPKMNIKKLSKYKKMKKGIIK